MDDKKFWKWLLKVHSDALIVCPDYGIHRLVDRLEDLKKRWEKEYGN